MDRLQKKLNEAFSGKVHAAHRGHFIELTGSLESWNDVVSAGSLASKNSKGLSIVNHIEFTGAPIPAIEKPKLSDSALEGRSPDVLVIGGGITGCAIARELSRYELDVLLVEKEHDLAMHASSRNDGMIHPGIDLKKGSEKYKYNLAGNRMYDRLAADLGVAFRRCGQYVCFRSALMLPVLHISRIYWSWLGLKSVKVFANKALHAAEPSLTPNLKCALFFPSTGIVCPYNLTIALGENAVKNGAQVSLDTIVEDMELNSGKIASVTTNRGKLFPKIVVNAAGVFADNIAAMAGDEFYSIHPRRGTNSILDSKYADSLSKTVVAALRSSSSKEAHTKGGGVVRTVENNILVGPDAFETFEKENFETKRESIEATISKHKNAVPALSGGQIITYFTGVRAPTYEEDFVVKKGILTKNLVHAAGIQSPGITAAPAIAVAIAEMVCELFEKNENKSVAKKQNFDPVRPPIIKSRELSTDDRDALIKQNPQYGVIVCRCEEISLAEILEAMRRNIPCDTLDGIKRRVRPGMGRCQGGFCGPTVASLIAEETGKPLSGVHKSGDGSRIVFGPVKEVAS